MKKLLLLLLCVPLMFSCGENENSLTRANIKGNVKEIIETTFDAKEDFGEPQKENLRRKYKYQYDEDGNITEETYYNADGDLLRKQKCQYDEDGNITEETDYNADGKIDWNQKYQYDENGNITEETSYNTDGELYEKQKYQYDENGNITEQIYYNADGELYKKNKYQNEYDKLKNWIERTYSENDKQISIIKREIEYYE